MDDERADRWYSAWIDPGSEDRRYFLVSRQDDDCPVGEACFYSYDASNGIAKFSMNVEAKYRGSGFAREALELILRFYFGPFSGRVMVDDIAPERRVAALYVGPPPKKK